MTEQQIHRPVDDDTLAALRDFTTSVGSTLGYPAVGDRVWRDHAATPADSAIVTATDDDALVGVLHLGAADADGVVTGSLVVAPSSRGRGVESDLVQVALGDLRGGGCVRLEYWVFGDAGDADSPSGPPVRALHEMRVTIPLTGADAAPAWPEGTRVRPFEPGADDDAWLAVNDRAFAHDPDQGGWTPDVLRQRVAEPWFDPAGFLLVEDAEGLAGFCWTKVHPPTPPFDPEPVGEIYVIAVDPGRQGTGLGRALVVAGLEWLAGQGITTGMLFVDAGNAPAVALYEALGFVATRTDRLFARAVGG
ncbi:MAG: mycothiol synthase [Acidimicrobiia bacterium]